ncbi:BglG family transcription antiterminator [Vagococcus sp. DIV0080]|uniref:BglG family transcription antiterminator n=1 Tax=Candidatus Vagococcus giribetii TaxID=2230876 RepID=A0ABS3HVI9_9ENTE|nr:BglG family transcription antiterminator [Vagococcus sp. DIV0080]MBO0477183.1 BglG family transcription antiterminator [Vagococcus sp. DIV0080]
MNQKEYSIMKSLLENQGTYITSQSLATELSLSDRTIRTYIKKMNDILSHQGAIIHSKTGYGYQLDILNRGKFDLFLKRQTVKLTSLLETPQIMEIEDRQNYILNKLLLEDAILNFDELAEKLFISQSSVTKDVNEIRERLKPYHLTVVSKTGVGFWIEGDEQEKRHFIMDTFFGKNYNNPLREHIGNSDLFQDISFEELTIIILDEAREERLKISDIIIQNLVLHLSLAIKRISEGFELKDSGILIDDNNVAEYKVASHIIERVEKNLAITFPKEEVGYLTLHLMAKSNNKNSQRDTELSDHLVYVLQHMSQQLNVNLVDDYQLFNGLLEHLKPMLVRLEQGIILKNPLKKTIRSNFPEAFDLTKKYLSQLPELQPYLINEDEWSYLSLHVMAALEKAKNTRKLQVLIICATGYGSAQLLRNRVTNEFGSYINVVDVLGYYELNETSLKNIDLIISSINLSSVLFKVPMVHVSVFLNTQDIHLIKKEINQIGQLEMKDQPKKQYNQKNSGRQYIEEHLTSDHFIIYDVPPTKERLISELLTRLSSGEDPHYIKKMTTQIQQRESMGEIVFSDTIVVPHPAQPIGITTKMAVAVVPEGMVWDHEKHIKFIFLISPSFIENEGITHLTKAIVRLVDDIETQEQILSNITFNNFRNHFIKITNQEEAD